MKVEASELAGSFPDVPVWALVGDASFLKEEAFRTIVGRREGGGPARTVDASDVEPADVLDDLRTPPMFDDARAIRVRGADAWMKKPVSETILAYVERPVRGATLVLEGEKLDGRTRLGRAVKKGEDAACVVCERPYDAPPPWKPDAPPWDNPLASWTRRRARGVGLSIDPRTAHALDRRVRSRLAAIAAAIERLREALGEGATVEREDVRALVPRTARPASGFDVVGAALDGDLAWAILLLDDMFRAGYEMGERVIRSSGSFGPMAVAAFRSELGRLRRLGELRRGASDREVASALGVRKPFVPRLKARLRRFGDRDPADLWPALHRADGDLKTSRRPVRLVLEELAIRVAGVDDPATASPSGGHASRARGG